MIELVYPKGTEQYFVTLQSLTLGPMDFTFKSAPEVSNFRSNLDMLKQGERMYGENAVMHTKVQGSVKVHPLLGSVIPTPTDTNPHRMIIPLYWNNGSLDNGTVVYGLFLPGDAYLVSTASNALSYRAVEHVPTDNHWIIYGITSASGDPSRVMMWERLECHSFMRAGYDPNVVFYSFDRTSYWTGQAMKSKVNLSDGLSFDQIKDWQPPPGTTLRVDKRMTYQTARVGRADMASTKQPAEIIRELNLLVAPYKYLTYPIEHVHYGDLAMQASEKMIHNETNMLEFFSGLRNPTQLIPKLKNLSKLKTLSENFLTVEYGLLPLVSDLKEIWESAKRIAPYLDKNGFQTLSAKSSSTQSEGNKTFMLEQHIKLAVDKEDNLFHELIQQAEGMGYLPTFENLWDLVPWSFVIDWFVNVGNFLERVDTRLRLVRLNIRYTTMSYKETTQICVGGTGIPYTGSVGLVTYHRWSADHCPLPPLSLQSKPDVSRHWLEAGALILSRRPN